MSKSKATTQTETQTETQTPAKTPKPKKVYGIQTRQHTIVSVPALPIRAQIKHHDSHIQLMFAGGEYVSLSGRLGDMAQADREALREVMLSATPTLATFSGSGALYHALAVIPQSDGQGFTLAFGDQDGPALNAIAFQIDPAIVLGTYGSDDGEGEGEGEGDEDEDEDEDEAGDPDDDDDDDL